MGLIEGEVSQPCRPGQDSARPERNLSECLTLGQYGEM